MRAMSLDVISWLGSWVGSVLVRPTPQQTPMASSPSTSSPPAKKASEYSQLSDFTESEAADTSIGSFHNNSAPLVPDNDDDAVSVAGTVFNEPWDSNAWENLLDLAKYSDEKPNVRAVAHNFYLNSTTTIEEEDIHSASPVDTDDVVVSCVDSDSDDAMTSQPDADPDQMTLNMATSVDSFGTGRKPAPIDNNRVWAEMSNRIPSEPSSKTSTIDHRKGKSSSLLNVAALGSGPGTLTRRAYTPGGITSDANPRQRSASARPPVNEPGARIQAYVEGLAKDGNTVFGATLRRFIECTIEGEENDPNNVIRNVRQFLNGIKNYLVKHGEGELHAMIEAESGNLTANEFLNIDAILEAVLHKILLVPVKNHLYHLMVKEHSRNGALQTLSENLRRVRGLSSSELGFPAETRMPDAKDLDAVKQCLRRMQNHYSPLKKLENLLRALAIVIVPNKAVNNNNVGDQSPRKVSLLQSGSLSGVLGSKKLPPAEELIRWLVYILAKTSSLNCEVEAWYMWELLPQQLLTTGDAAYYLTTLFSAVHVLKHPESIRRLGRGFPLTDEHADAFVNVAIPDEQSGSIEYHTFPAVPQMNAAKLCRVIAHQFAITNPEDYGLYILVDGYETCLLPAECPDAIRDQLLENGKPHLFAFKRHEAKIAWPKNVISAAAPASPSPKLSPSASEHAAFQLRPARAVQPSPIHKRRQFPVASRMV
uniref:VPS9 domain-containing protein n=1 Tax=Panagrellus redivivus TaxID=6233 RepID=A0A7E4W3U7_PANRE